MQILFQTSLVQMIRFIVVVFVSKTQCSFSSAEFDEIAPIFLSQLCVHRSSLLLEANEVIVVQAMFGQYFSDIDFLHAFWLQLFNDADNSGEDLRWFGVIVDVFSTDVDEDEVRSEVDHLVEKVEV